MRHKIIHNYQKDACACSYMRTHVFRRYYYCCCYCFFSSLLAKNLDLDRNCFCINASRTVIVIFSFSVALHQRCRITASHSIWLFFICSISVYLIDSCAQRKNYLWGVVEFCDIKCCRCSKTITHRTISFSLNIILGALHFIK